MAVGKLAGACADFGIFCEADSVAHAATTPQKAAVPAPFASHLLTDVFIFILQIEFALLEFVDAERPSISIRRDEAQLSATSDKDFLDFFRWMRGGEILMENDARVLLAATWAGQDTGRVRSVEK